MKMVFALAMVLMAFWVFMGILPGFNAVLTATDTTGYPSLLAAFVGNLWWIAIVLGVVACASAWWLYQR